MMIILLEECNFTCDHCAREDEPMEPGYKLSFRQLQQCLSDCRKLEGIRWVHFTGGEPTLWEEENKSLIDLLLEIANNGFTPGFTTNGSFSINITKCQNFITKYFDASSMPLRIYFSIDTFHKNFNLIEERARCLDSIIKCKQGLPKAQADLLDIHVMTVISKELKSLLPDKMIGYYKSLGINFGFVPLFPMGKARSLSHLCPDLSSGNPKDLGAYQRFHQKKIWEKRDKTKNQHRADFINLIGNDYYFTNPWRKVAVLGNLPDAIIRAYTSQTEDLC